MNGNLGFETNSLTNSSLIKNRSFELEVEKEYPDNVIDFTSRKRPIASVSIENSNIKTRFKNTNNIFNSTTNDFKDKDEFLIKRQKFTTDSYMNDAKLGTPNTVKFDNLYEKYLKRKEICLDKNIADADFYKFFKELINESVKEHLLAKISLLVNDFLSTVSTLLRQQKLTTNLNIIKEWLVDCFNSTSQRNHVECYYEILLQDYFIYNKNFLGTLKLVTLQLILIQRDTNENLTGCILTFLAYDKRYLFGFSSSREPKIKLPNLIKILLHLCSFNKNIKFFILCKILEYISIGTLEISMFLPQMKFNSDLISLIKSSYKLIDKNTNTLASAFLEKVDIKMDILPIKEPFNLNDVWRSKIEQTFKTSKNTLKLYELYNHYINYFWTHTILIKKRDLDIMKRILIKINDSLEYTKDYKSELIFLLDSILSNIMNLMISINEISALDNLTNIFFNLFVTHQDELFLKHSIDCNFYIFLNSWEEIIRKECLNKFFKYFKCLKSKEMRMSLFRQIFTISSLNDDDSLHGACEFAIDHCHQYRDFLSVGEVNNFEFSSDLMKSLFISGNLGNLQSEFVLPDKLEWSLLTKMLFQVISLENDVVIINFEDGISNNMCLYKDRHFIKCCFQFYKEMKKRSMTKLFDICEYYLQSVWLNRGIDYKISSIESEFLKNLFQYLKLNGFYQLIVKIYQTISHHKNITSELKKNLKTTYLQVKNCLIGSKHKFFIFNDEDFKAEIDFDYINIMLEQQTNFATLTTFKKKLALSYPCIWDYTNSSKMSKPLYIKILLLNMSFALKEGALVEITESKHVESLQNYKLVLSLAKSILKSSSFLPQLIRITVIEQILEAFEKIIDLVLLMSNYLYYEYFIKEFDIILGSINEPMIKFKKYSLSIEFAELVFDKQEKFQSNILRQLDLANSDLIFLEYCKREDKLDLIFEAFKSTNILMYKKVLLKKKYKALIEHSVETPLCRMLNGQLQSNDYKRLSLNSMKEQLEYECKPSTRFWNDCYKTLGISYEKHLTENVSDYINEDKEFEYVKNTHHFDVAFNSKVVCLDYSSKNLIIEVVENRQRYSFELKLKENLISDFSYNLKKIIKASNDSTAIQVTSKITTKEQRRDWWVKRYSLDAELERLLKEFSHDCDLMTLKPLFNQNELDITHLNFKSFEQCLKANGFQEITPLAIRLVHSGMCPKMFKQLNLVSKSVNIDKLYDFISFNKELINNLYIHYDHTYLVLTDLFHNFPWESMPAFEKINITRIPSLALLKNLLSKDVKRTIKMDHTDISLILNPNNDLAKTQENFEHIFEPVLNKKIVGKAPTEKQYIEFITNSKLFVYLGHGSGVQYTSSKMIKRQDQIAPSLLIGCSSVKITNTNSFFGYGTLISYLIGGSPMVLGNLWDVTDKDIDLFSFSLFKNLGIIDSEFKNLNKRIDAACRNSRKECRLKYLNGAAPVIYGLPLEFELN